MPIVPDSQREQEIKAKLTQDLQTVTAAFDSADQLKEKFILRGMEAAEFMEKQLPRWQNKENIVITVSDKVPQFTYDTSDPDVKFSVDERSTATDWFDLQITVTVSGEKVPFAELFAALVEERAEFMLPSGRYFPLNHVAFDTLRKLISESTRLSDVEKNGISLSKYQVDYWRELEQLGLVDAQSQAWKKHIRQMKQAEIVMYQPPKRLKATLRDYQQKGYSWLRFLYTNSMGGF